MRVLTAAIRYPPSPGGAETHAHEVARELARRGHEVDVYTSDLMREHPIERIDGPLEGVLDGVRVHRRRAYRLGKGIEYFMMPGEVGMLRREADVVHSHSFGYFHTNLLALRRRLRDTPLVITPHYHPPDTMEGGRARQAMRRLYDSEVASWVFDQADAIIAVSRAELGSMAHHIRDLDKVRVIPNGIDPGRFGELPSAEDFLAPRGIEGPLLLYVGRMAQNKRMELLIEAMPALLKAVPDLTLVIAGPDDGVGAAWARQAADLGLGGHVRFEGFLSERDLLAAYTAADVLVLPSEWEAFGIVLLEAMACRTPCVVSDRGGAPEVVEDGATGLVAPFGDRAAWEDAVLRLLQDDRGRRVMGERGREVALTSYSWSSVVDRIEALYRELADAGRAGGAR